MHQHVSTKWRKSRFGFRRIWLRKQLFIEVMHGWWMITPCRDAVVPCFLEGYTTGEYRVSVGVFVLSDKWLCSRYRASDCPTLWNKIKIFTLVLPFFWKLNPPLRKGIVAGVSVVASMMVVGAVIFALVLRRKNKKASSEGEYRGVRFSSACFLLTGYYLQFLRVWSTFRDSRDYGLRLELIEWRPSLAVMLHTWHPRGEFSKAKRSGYTCL